MQTKVMSASRTGSGISVEVEGAKDGKKESLDCDVLLVCVGRRPYTANLGLESVGLKLDDKGRVPPPIPAECGRRLRVFKGGCR